MRFALYFLFFVSTSISSGQTSSPSLLNSSRIKGFTVSSETLDRDLEQDTITLSGQVKIIYQLQYFEADEAFVDFKKKQAVFTGNVKIQTPTYQIGGQKITLDYESNQGIIYVGYVQSNNVRFQGDMIEKYSDTEFYVTQAEYTTCSNCPSTWSFEGTRIRAELGGYAYIRSSFLKVSSIPVFWLPYLVVPLKSERQTGLLTPEIGHINNRQLVFTQDFFWAISRSQDATITFKNYELGGLKPKLEYRYVLNDLSYGQINAAHLRDTVFASQENYNLFLPEADKNRLFNRWSVRSYNQYSWDKHNKAQLQLSLISDLQYPKDFPDEYKNYADPALENRFSVSHFFEHSLVSLDASYYTNLLEANPLAKNSGSVHRLPELRFDSTYKKIDFLQSKFPLYYRFESSWTQFYRGKFYDDISLAGGQNYVSNNLNDPSCESKSNLNPNCQLVEDQIYNANQDLIRAGQRAKLKATLRTDTFNPTNLINITPTLSYNEAQYRFQSDSDNHPTRRFLQLDVNTRTKFYKIYGNDQSTSGKKYKNEIIPEFQYSVIPWINTDSNPFFGNTTDAESIYTSRGIVSDGDLNTPGGVLFDYEDRVYDRHIVTFSLLDRLVQKRIKENVYKTIVNFRLAQSYDLYQSQYGKKRDQPLSDLSATLTVDLEQIQSYTQMNYYPYLSATNTTTSLSYLNQKQQYFKIGWTSTRDSEPKTDDVSLSLGFVSTYVNVLTGAIFDARKNKNSSSRLKKLSLITQLKPPGECWAVNFYRDEKVGSQTEWHVRFVFSFDGKPTKVIPPAELNIN